MKLYISYVVKNILKQKTTAILIIIAITLSTLMTTALGQSISVLQTLREQQAISMSGNQHVTFHNIDEKQVESIKMHPEVENVSSNISLGSVELDCGFSLLIKEYVNVNNALSVFPATLSIKTGKFPTAPNEIALSEDALKRLNIPAIINEPINLDLSISSMRVVEYPYTYTGKFILTGIFEDNYFGHVSKMLVGVVGSGTAINYLPQRHLVYSTSVSIIDRKNFQNIVNEITDELNISSDLIHYNTTLLEVLNIEFDANDSNTTEGFPLVVLTIVFMGLLILLSAGIVVYNILKIATAKQVKQYGILRALGADKRQLYFIVFNQTILLCIIGIPIGCILGLMAVDFITETTTSLFATSIFLADSAERLNYLIQNNTIKILPLILSILITLISALLASLPSARFAAKVPPTIAISGTKIEFKRKNRDTKTIRSYEAYLGWLNLKRSKGRTVVTVISLVLSITVLLSLNSFKLLLDASLALQQDQIGEFSIINKDIGISNDILQELSENKLISSTTAVQRTIYHQNVKNELEINTDFSLKHGFETFQIWNIDKEHMRRLGVELSASDIYKFNNGIGIIVHNPEGFVVNGEIIEPTSFEIGETITINDIEMEVVHILEDPLTLSGEGFVLGVQIIVDSSTYSVLTRNDNFAEIHLSLVKSADIEEVESVIEDIVNRIPNTQSISNVKLNQQLEDSFKQINFLAWGLIILVALIGLLNIMNTTFTNIHLRTSEIGIQRAIGMDRNSLYKLFLWESAYYGIIASVIGITVGTLSSIFINLSITGSLSLNQIPLLLSLKIFIITILACLLINIIPLWKISKMNIVDAIQIVD